MCRRLQFSIDKKEDNAQVYFYTTKIERRFVCDDVSTEFERREVTLPFEGYDRLSI